MSHKWTNASELAEYQYCRRAWWYKAVQGQQSANVRRLEFGRDFHSRHHRRVRRLPWLRGLAYALLFIAVAMIVFQIAIGSW